MRFIRPSAAAVILVVTYHAIAVWVTDFHPVWLDVLAAVVASSVAFFVGRLRALTIFVLLVLAGPTVVLFVLYKVVESASPGQGFARLRATLALTDYLGMFLPPIAGSLAAYALRRITRRSNVTVPDGVAP